MDQKPILCLDFDGVIHSYSSGWQGADVVSDPPVDGALDFILDAREHFTVAIYSSRSGKQSGVTAMQGWLMSHMLQHSQEAGGPRDFGTESIAEVIDSIDWATEKPPAMVTIDDRALTFTGVWPRMDGLTSFKPWNKVEPSQTVEQALVDGGFEFKRLDRASIRQGPTWECKIGVTNEKSAVLRGGADSPMRDAIEAEFLKQTGMEPDFIFSGWGAALTPVQMEIISGDPDGGVSDVRIVGYRGKDAAPVTLMLSDGAEIHFDPSEFQNGG